jgi:hypothetical protein
MTRMIAACLLLTTIYAAEPAVEIRPERVGRLNHPAIREASGLAASRRFPGVYWTHNDSGNPPVLFAVHRDGSLIREFPVGAPNVDWEDVTLDDQGHLYIGDIGNNDNRLPMRVLYRLDEPDPGKPATAPLKVTASIFYRFPDSGRFDAESLVIDGYRALIVAKLRDNTTAVVYALSLKPAPLLKPTVPRRVGVLPDFATAATGASLSADGKRLVVCSTSEVGVFVRDGLDEWKPLSLSRFRLDDQIEAVTWDGDDVLLAGEGRGIYRVPPSDWRRAADTRKKR